MIEVHQGSWGLPDIGLTELAGKILGAQTTYQGGSDISATAGTSNVSNPQSVGTANLSTAAYNTYNPPQMSYNPTMYSSVQNQSVGTPTIKTPTPTQQPTNTNNTINLKDPFNKPSGDGWWWDAADGWKRELQAGADQDQAMIDAAYQEIISPLDQARERVLAQRPGLLQEAEQAYNLYKQQVGASQERGQQALGAQDIEAERRRQLGTDLSRRLYNDLLRGGVQRFGGATSAGEGYKDLLGVEQQRSSSQRFQEYSNAKREIETQMFNLNRDTEMQMMQVENNFQAAKNQIERDISDRISEIDTRKGMALQEKQLAKLNVLQAMRANIQQLNFELAQSRMAIQQQAQASAAELAAYNNAIESYSGAGAKAAGSIGTDVNSTLYLGADNTPGLSFSSPYTGMTTNGNEEDYWSNLRGALGTKREQQ